MSKYLICTCVYHDWDCLKAALCDLGFAEGKIQFSEQTPQALEGYHGDKREEKAHLIIPRQYVGHVSNDIGFIKESTGEIKTIISEFDQRTDFGETWQNKLTQYYAKHKMHKILKAKGMKWSERVNDKGEICITVNA